MLPRSPYIYIYIYIWGDGEDSKASQQARLTHEGEGAGRGGGTKKLSLSPLCDKALWGRTAMLSLWDGIRGGYMYGVYSTTTIASMGEGLCVLDGKGLG